MAIEMTQRKVNYFEILPEYLVDNTISNFTQIFTEISKLSKNKDKSRYVFSNEKTLYIRDIVFDPKEKKITGKLLGIRTDVFPELINTVSDTMKDIEADEDDGVVETSHFILSYSKEPLILSIEFNQYGPRVSDFIYYIRQFSFSKEVFEEINFHPYHREDLPSYKKRINRVSLVYAKVHKDSIKRINEFDSELFDAFATAEKVSDAEYVTLQLKYDYQEQTATTKIRTKILSIIDKFVKDKNTLSTFTTLKVRAEDEDRNNKLKEFDLLNIFVKSEIKVQKKEKSRAIISADIFEKMKVELQKEFKR
jgi:hypothetical protein